MFTSPQPSQLIASPPPPPGGTYFVFDTIEYKAPTLAELDSRTHPCTECGRTGYMQIMIGTELRKCPFPDCGQFQHIAKKCDNPGCENRIDTRGRNLRVTEVLARAVFCSRACAEAPLRVSQVIVMNDDAPETVHAAPKPAMMAQPVADYVRTSALVPQSLGSDYVITVGLNANETQPLRQDASMSSFAPNRGGEIFLKIFSAQGYLKRHQQQQAMPGIVNLDQGEDVSQDRVAQRKMDEMQKELSAGVEKAIQSKPKQSRKRSRSRPKAPPPVAEPEPGPEPEPEPEPEEPEAPPVKSKKSSKSTKKRGAKTTIGPGLIYLRYKEGKKRMAENEGRIFLNSYFGFDGTIENMTRAVFLAPTTSGDYSTRPFYLVVRHHASEREHLEFGKLHDYSGIMYPQRQMSTDDLCISAIPVENAEKGEELANKLDFYRDVGNPNFIEAFQNILTPPRPELPDLPAAIPYLPTKSLVHRRSKNGPSNPIDEQLDIIEDDLENAPIPSQVPELEIEPEAEPEAEEEAEPEAEEEKEESESENYGSKDMDEDEDYLQ